VKWLVDQATTVKPSELITGGFHSGEAQKFKDVLR
jgi:hypothetical protein